MFYIILDIDLVRFFRFCTEDVDEYINIKGYNITLTTSQVPEVINQSKNNNSQGPEN